MATYRITYEWQFVPSLNSIVTFVSIHAWIKMNLAVSNSYQPNEMRRKITTYETVKMKPNFKRIGQKQWRWMWFYFNGIYPISYDLNWSVCRSQANEWTTKGCISYVYWPYALNTKYYVDTNQNVYVCVCVRAMNAVMYWLLKRLISFCSSTGNTISNQTIAFVSCTCCFGNHSNGKASSRVQVECYWKQIHVSNIL